MSSISRGLRKLRLKGKRGSADSGSDKKDTRRMRKRLSITDADGASPMLLDGTVAAADVGREEQKMNEVQCDNAGSQSMSTAYKHYAMKSSVGMAPFNPNKVNQDRAMIVETCLGLTDNAMFGVFDGHGMHGDDVSSFLTREMPKLLHSEPLSQEFVGDPDSGLKVLFQIATKALAQSSVNCTFSGTTATVAYMNEETIWTANAGDSRAVVAVAGEDSGDSNDSSEEKWTCVPLSFDHKPDSKDEKARIEKSNGRVEPCKGPMGKYIGPARVWLKHQDMPGLAMSRSFGDDVATAVGVNSEADVVKHTRSAKDRRLIMGSDGIWEFISNQEAVDIIRPYTTAAEACKALADEATHRWQKEEEVIDDITCVVVFL